MSAKYINPKLPGMIRDLHKGDPSMNSVKMMLALAGDLVQELIDLRAALAEQGETEWEYGVSYPWYEGNLSHAVEFESEPVAREHMDEDEDVLVRRRKAGPWLPVPGSTVRESDSGVRDSDNEESEGE